MVKTVYVGMSGGVDSSVSAALLKDQGYRVVGVYMKNWSRDLPGMQCPWAEDLADAKRVAVKLGIDFKVFDFEKEYKAKVVDYMLAEFQAGRTPNPDIMCNQEVKFKLFYDIARSEGADLIATGHYARVARAELSCSDRVGSARRHGRAALNLALPRSGCPSHDSSAPLLMCAADDNKDQTYFLYRISDEALNHTIFPIGHLKKPAVKQLAEQYGLHTAHKKESMGVCFVGEVGMKDFIKSFVQTKPGPIQDADTHQTLGYHDGAILYTVGQRHGLDIGGGLPYYVTGKDVKKNIVYVSKNLNHQDLWTTELELEDVVWRGAARADLMVRLRHRAPLVPAQLKGNKLIFAAPIKRPASGQSAVFYHDQICLGGGIIK